MQKYTVKDSEVITFKDIDNNKVTFPVEQVSRIGVNSDGKYLVWIDSYSFEFQKLMYGMVIVSKETYLALLSHFENLLAC